MAFDIPNEVSATFAPQAAVDSTDIDIIVAAVDDNGAITGCAVAAQASPNMTVQISAGTVYINGATVAVSSVASLAIGAAGASDRKDMVVVNNAGTVSVVAGGSSGAVNGVTASGGRDPVKGTIPANSVVLAEVYVATTTASVANTNITDKRISVLQTVTIDTTQTISGAKTFSSTVTVSSGDVAISSGVASFASTTRQMVNLFSTTYGIGVQNSTVYYRAAALGGHAWFSGGIHSNTQNDPGTGGVLLATLSGGGTFSPVAFSLASGATFVVGTRNIWTGSRTTTTNATDTVDLGSFSSTGGAIELRVEAHLAAPAAGTTASVTKVYDIATSTSMGFATIATNMTNVGTLVTVTVGSTAGLINGQSVTISGATGLTNVNGTWTVSSVTGTTFQFTATSTPAGTYTASSAVALAWYLCLPVDASAIAVSSNDFALEVQRTGLGVFKFRFRQKAIGLAGAITWAVESVGDTTVAFAASTTVTAAPPTVVEPHPSNSLVQAGSSVGIGTDAPSSQLHILGNSTTKAKIQAQVSGQSGASFTNAAAATDEFTDSAAGDLLIANIDSTKAVRLGAGTGAASMVRITSTDALLNDSGTARSIPRGLIYSSSKTSATTMTSGINTETTIDAGAARTYTNGRMYLILASVRVQGGNIGLYDIRAKNGATLLFTSTVSIGTVGATGAVTATIAGFATTLSGSATVSLVGTQTTGTAAAWTAQGSAGIPAQLMIYDLGA